MPNFDIKIEKVKKPESSKEPTAPKKDDKKKDDKKAVPVKVDEKKGKKAAAPKEVPKPVAPVEVVAVKWTPPELKFAFYDFKTEFVNSKDKAATL
jgi:hypothetical protein